MERAKEQEIVEHLENDSMVVRVIDPKSEEMGDGVYRWAGGGTAFCPGSGRVISFCVRAGKGCSLSGHQPAAHLHAPHLRPLVCVRLEQMWCARLW